jgi:hypothetical protein
MATPLQALERMLLSQERREEARVRESLGMMQLAQQAAYQRASLAQTKSYQDAQQEMAKQKQDIEIFGTNLELIQKFNETTKIRSAENFLQQTGLSGLYATHKDDEDGLEEFVDDLEDLGVDKQIASTLASATWSAFEQNNPNAIINVGSKLHYLDKKDVLPTAYDKKLSNAFIKLGYLQGTSAAQKEDFLKLNRDAINTFKTMRKTLDNEVSLAKEVSEFATGDYKIQTEFDIIDESLKKIELEKIPTPSRSIKTSFDDPNMESILPLDKAVKFKKDITQGRKNELDKLVNNLEQLEIQSNLYNQYKNRTDIISQMPQSKIDQMENADEMMIILKEEIENAKKSYNESLKSQQNVQRLFREDVEERFPSAFDMFGM